MSPESGYLSALKGAKIKVLYVGSADEEGPFRASIRPVGRP